MYLNERRYFPFTESKEEFPFDSQRNRERIYASESGVVGKWAWIWWVYLVAVRLELRFLFGLCFF